MRVLLIGHGCREAALAKSIARDAELFAVMVASNPLISELSQDQRIIPSYSNSTETLAYASEIRSDLIMLGPENSIASGLPDALEAAGLWACAPNRRAFQLEENKVYMRQFLDRHLPKCNVQYRVLSTRDEIDEFFRAPPWPMAVKPVGLTGGKGVRVLDINLDSIEAAAEYATACIDKSNSVLVERRVDDAVEYTLHCVTDGEHTSFFPASYDYSYRDPGDTGPQTGGMGCYVNSTPHLPFMSDKDYVQCCEILRRVIDALKTEGIAYRGVLQGQFFLTANGPKICEFACRFGDPEVIPLLSTLRYSWTEVMSAVRDKTLQNGPFESNGLAGVALCLAPPDYPTSDGADHRFDIPDGALKRAGVEFLPGSCERASSGTYRACGGRVGALCATSGSISDARNVISGVLPQIKNLYYRDDVATPIEIAGKVSLTSNWHRTP